MRGKENAAGQKPDGLTWLDNSLVYGVAHEASGIVDIQLLHEIRAVRIDRSEAQE